MATFQDRACEVYREVAQLPVPSGARIFYSESDLYELEVKWSQKDLDRGKKLSFAKSYMLQRSSNEKIKVLVTSNFQRDTNRICLESYSTTGGIKAVLVKDTTSKSEKGADPQQFIEIWESNRLVKSLNVKEQFSKHHGEIKDDDRFSSFKLSHDGSKLLYMAEKKNPDSISFFKKSSNDETESNERGTEYTFQQNWGDSYTDVICPVAVVLDIATEECVVIDCPDDVSCARGVWVPDSTTQLVFVGYCNNPLKLGILYFYKSRKSTLYFADLEKESCIPLTDNTNFINELRFNPQGTKLVFIENDAPYPNRKLKMVDWETKSISTVVDIVDSPTETGFTGIYAIVLPERCWDPTGNVLIYSDQQKSYIHIMSIDIATGAVNCLTANTELGCYGVLDVYNGLLVGRYSNPSHPRKIFITQIPNSFNDKFNQSDFIDIACNEISISDMIKWKVIDINRGEGSLPYQAIFISPAVTSSPPPLIVFPHGGPNIMWSAEFGTWNVCFAALGYSVLLVNYNGSTGYGRDFITNLIGKNGSLDVQDVHFAVRKIVENGECNESNIMLRGGSYSGYLALYLMSLYPDYYKASFLRNPASNLITLLTTSDIPDWVHEVIGLPYDPAMNVTPEIYSELIKISPIIHAHKIKGSLVFALGGNDRRCPPCQSKHLYHVLKAQGKDVKILWYPKDSHPLLSVDTDADCFVNCALLYQNALN